LRKTSKLDNIRDLTFEKVYGDLQDPDSLKEAVAGVDYIFHAGGIVRAFDYHQFHRVNGEGTRNLVEAAVEQSDRLKRFIYVSSQAAAGPGKNGEPRVESDRPAPISDYGQSKLSGELAVHKYADQIPVTIIRPPAVFGPRDTDVLQFFQMAEAGWLIKFGGREPFVSVAYVKDVIAGIVAAAQSDKAVGETFFVNTEDRISFWKAQEMISDALRVQTKPLRIPVPILRLAAVLDTNNAKRSKRTPNLTPDKIGELICPNWTCSSAKARELLGYAPQLPLQEALNLTADWYREQRWL